MVNLIIGILNVLFWISLLASPFLVYWVYQIFTNPAPERPRSQRVRIILACSAIVAYALLGVLIKLLL